MNDDGGGLIQKSSQELTRNTKGYTWKIKIYKEETETDDDIKKRVDKLNQDYMDSYGAQYD